VQRPPTHGFPRSAAGVGLPVVPGVCARAVRGVAHGKPLLVEGGTVQLRRRARVRFPTSHAVPRLTKPRQTAHAPVACSQMDTRLVADSLPPGIWCSSPQESDCSAHVHHRESVSDGRVARQQQPKVEPGQDADGRRRKHGTACSNAKRQHLRRERPSPAPPSRIQDAAVVLIWVSLSGRPLTRMH
jgi:hypothetical protein